jgi:hypothetical protein
MPSPREQKKARKCVECHAPIGKFAHLCEPCAQAVCESNGHTWDQGESESQFVCEVCRITGEVVVND